MIINEIHIGHFGKLHNLDMRFDDGLNIVMGGNESGKTTIFAFIGAMLFGLDKGRGRAGRDDPYMRYKPWDTPGAYQGSMDFSHEGHKYRITRVFYQKEKSCNLTDLATGRQIPLADDSITSLIPELTRSAFYNTVGMGQNALNCSSDFGPEVGNYLANLAMTGGSRVDVPGATACLEARAKELMRQIRLLDADALQDRQNHLVEAEREACDLDDRRCDALAGAGEMRSRIEELKKRIPDTSALSAELQKAKEEADLAVEELLQLQKKDSEADRIAGAGKTKLRNAGFFFLAAAFILCLAGNDRSAILIGAGIIMGLASIVMLMTAFLDRRALQKAQRDQDSTGKGSTEEAAAKREEKNRLLEDITARLDSAIAERERIAAETEELDRQADELESTADRLEWQIENLGDIGEEMEICKHALADANRKEKELATELEAVNIARENIERLSAGLHDGFKNSFNDYLSEEVCLVTDGRYSRARINDDFEVEVMSGIDFVSASSLSSGAQSQLLTALRFATARLFFKDTEVPMLLDEIFAYSDENRMRSALSAIADREGQQIILFTCRHDEGRILMELGAGFTVNDLGGMGA